MHLRYVLESCRGKGYQVAVSAFGLVLLVFCVVWSALSAPQQKRQISYDDLISVTFPTESDGWACGRWGTVLHTGDGGRNWARQETGTDFTLSAISFPDTKHGWAVGDEGIIIHTADGGKTWQKQKSPVPFFLMGVQFVTPRKGWIVTERTHILNTEDGGNTWKVQFKEDDFILKAVSFCDALNGWAAGEYGFIYHTQDGGKTWIKEAGTFGISETTGGVEGGEQLFGVVAVDPQTAWAVGIDGYVTRTTDGGRNWARVPLPASTTQLFGVVATKAGTTVVVGRRNFLVSPDRGKSWKSAKLDPPFPYGWMYGVALRGPSNIVVVGQQGAIYLNRTSVFDLWQRVQY